MNTLDDLIIGRKGLWFTLEEVIKAFQLGDFLVGYESDGLDCTKVILKDLRITVTKERFKQRARELGYGVEAAKPDGWYCYETQKALRLPPVGVECIVLDNVRAKIVGQTASGYLVYQSVETGFCEMACQATSFKPLDWNRKKYEAIEAASKCFQAHCMHDYSGQPFLDGLAGLYDAGFLRMPEDK